MVCDRVDRRIAAAGASRDGLGCGRCGTQQAGRDRLRCQSKDGIIACSPPGPARAGSIFVDLKKPVIACNVVDISAGGACIEVHGADTIPTRFILNHGGVKKSCHVVWQKGRRVGVSF
jgi:hypothetical protein